MQVFNETNIFIPRLIKNTMKKQFITEARRFQKLAGIIKEGTLVNEAYDNEPTDEKYIAVKNKVKNYLELAYKEINDYEDSMVPQGMDWEDYFFENGYPSKLFSDAAIELENIISYFKK
jgi:hypothetical protein